MRVVSLTRMQLEYKQEVMGNVVEWMSVVCKGGSRAVHGGSYSSTY